MSLQDPFDILGLPPRFDVAPAQLRAAFLAKSGELHPDLAGAGELHDAGQAASLNYAKRTLENPESRAEALLARLGGPSKEADRSLPPAFLQEMLEVREQIDAVITSGSPEEAVKWEQWADQRRRDHITAVAQLFSDLARIDAPPDSRVLRAIRMELNMWRYVERLIEQLNDAADGQSGPRGGGASR